jgi:hypothetical protein
MMNGTIRHCKSNGCEFLAVSNQFGALRYVGRGMTEIGQFNSRPLIRVEGRLIHPTEMRGIKVMPEVMPLEVVVA